MNQQIEQYCRYCGKPLKAQARFCGRCGKPVLQLQAPPQAAPPPAPAHSPPVPAPAVSPSAAEIVVAALPPGTQRSGFLGMKAEGYVLVLTNVRILLAKQTSELLKASARQAKEAAKQSGQGFFGQWGAVMGSSGSQRYLQMQPQEILNETPGNSFWLNNQIRSVRVKESYDPDLGQSETSLTFETGNGKIQFRYKQSNKKELKQLLQQTLGNRVR